MAYTDPTVADFKAQFFRDFPYSVMGSGAVVSAVIVAGGLSAIQVVDGGGAYVANPVVTISGGGGTGATATAIVQDGVITGFNVTAPGTGYTSPPTVTIAGRGDPTNLSKVQDQDITNALAMAKMNVNPPLFPDQPTYAMCFNLLAAHYLVTNLTASSLGVSGTFEWLVAAKSVGNVSENYQIPPKVLNDPFLATISKTRYGAQYLSLIATYLIGNLQVLCRQASAQ